MVELRQGYAVLLATGVLVCCGGQSARTSGDKRSETSGGSPSAGTSGQPSDAVGGSTDVGGAGGASGSAGAAPVGGSGGSGMIEVKGDCTRWEEASLTDSCSQLRDCPTDLWSYVASVQDELVEPYRARVGCGLVEIAPVRAPFGGAVFVFQEGGSLAGYSLSSDLGWGPCSQSIYQRGSTLADCETVRECDIAVDARNTKQICACGCPDVAPPDGIASAEVTCIYPATLTGESTFVGCPLELAESRQHASASRSALLSYGCGFSIVSLFGLDDDIVECVYGGEGIWIGARRTEADGSKECANVQAWKTGQYTTCEEKDSCWLGTEGPPEGVERCTEPD